MKVLSLFDGMSCGRIALERAGIKVDSYFASEIDKHAIQVSKANYPDIFHIGDVTKIKAGLLNPIPDLVIGGSPCQTLSVAGDGSGFDGKSGLFFEYVRILREVKEMNPNVKFLLENVKMKKEWKDIISKELGVEPLEINSNLVSAQNRKRLYWTNIIGITQPVDKGIYLKDILELEVDEKYFYSEKAISYLDRAKINKRFAMYSDNEKSICLTANFHKSIPYNVYVDREKANCLTQNYGNMACVNYNRGQGQIVFSKEILQINDSKESGGKQPYMQNRIYDSAGISPALTQFSNRLNIFHNDKIRRLTPTECEKLQTVPINYTNHVSNTQRYRMLGNGWTIDVIAHIFSFLK